MQAAEPRFADLSSVFPAPSAHSFNLTTAPNSVNLKGRVCRTATLGCPAQRRRGEGGQPRVAVLLEPQTHQLPSALFATNGMGYSSGRQDFDARWVRRSAMNIMAGIVAFAFLPP